MDESILSDSVDSMHSNDKENIVHEMPEDDRPIMQLFYRLINGHRNEGNTVLTNSQIISILQKELKLDILELQVLEVDIYMNIMKKFLKDWPKWDSFDKIISELKKIKGNGFKKDSSKKILEKQYCELKAYLKKILEMSTPLAKKAVEDVKENTDVPKDTPVEVKEKDLDESEVVMEIQCTRQQLNQLFFRHPNPNYNNSIFNVTEYTGPSRISLNSFKIKSIFNWALVSISVNCNHFSYKRDMLHKWQHKLINKKLKESITVPECLDLDLEVKVVKNKSVKIMDQQKILKCVKKTKNQLMVDIPENSELIREVFDTIREDIKNILPKLISVPGLYRKTLNKYPYVRYLYKDVASNAHEQFDLQLEERDVPQLYTHINKVTVGLNPYIKPKNDEWLLIECGMCQLKFTGSSKLEDIEEHFNDIHQHEPDWLCTNCHKSFHINNLAKYLWYHTCSNRII